MQRLGKDKVDPGGRSRCRHDIQSCGQTQDSPVRGHPSERRLHSEAAPLRKGGASQGGEKPRRAASLSGSDREGDGAFACCITGPTRKKRACEQRTMDEQDDVGDRVSYAGRSRHGAARSI